MCHPTIGKRQDVEAAEAKNYCFSILKELKALYPTQRYIEEHRLQADIAHLAFVRN